MRAPCKNYNAYDVNCVNCPVEVDPDCDRFESLDKKAPQDTSGPCRECGSVAHSTAAHPFQEGDTAPKRDPLAKAWKFLLRRHDGHPDQLWVTKNGDLGTKQLYTDIFVGTEEQAGRERTRREDKHDEKVMLYGVIPGIVCLEEMTPTYGSPEPAPDPPLAVGQLPVLTLGERLVWAAEFSASARWNRSLDPLLRQKCALEDALEAVLFMRRTAGNNPLGDSQAAMMLHDMLKE
jgi:hypothetical protein